MSIAFVSQGPLTNLIVVVIKSKYLTERKQELSLQCASSGGKKLLKKIEKFGKNMLFEFCRVGDYY